MIYALLKAAHLTAMVVWLAGMITTPLALSALRKDEARRADAIGALRERERRIFGPAMLLTWALGMTLALQGGWFASGWIWAKLALVLLLSALHGVTIGQISRAARDPAHTPPPHIAAISGATIAALAVIAVLAGLKPF